LVYGKELAIAASPSDIGLVAMNENASQKARAWSVDRVLLELRKHRASKKDLAGMARFGIKVENRIGASMIEIRKLGKRIGHDHELSLALWATGVPDARIVATLVDDPSMLTVSQMNAWVKDLDSWDICDQVCMNLFSRTSLAWERVRVWSVRKGEFEKRAAFALIACLTRHDKSATDADFAGQLPLIRREATDERNYVKKAVSWALRNIGKRSPSLQRDVLETARQLLKTDSRSACWIARAAIRELEPERS